MRHHFSQGMQNLPTWEWVCDLELWGFVLWGTVCIYWYQVHFCPSVSTMSCNFAPWLQGTVCEWRSRI